MGAGLFVYFCDRFVRPVTRCTVFVKEHFFLLYVGRFFSLLIVWTFHEHNSMRISKHRHYNFVRSLAFLAVLDEVHLLLTNQLSADLTLESNGESKFCSESSIHFCFSSTVSKWCFLMDELSYKMKQRRSLALA